MRVQVERTILKVSWTFPAEITRYAIPYKNHRKAHLV